MRLTAGESRFVVLICGEPISISRTGAPKLSFFGKMAVTCGEQGVELGFPSSLERQGRKAQMWCHEAPSMNMIITQHVQHASHPARLRQCRRGHRPEQDPVVGPLIESVLGFAH